jgi:hypothetical protein
MNFSLFRRVLAVAFASIALASCATSDPTRAPGRGQPDPLPADAYPNVAVEDPLQPWVGVGEPVAKHDPLQVSVPVRMMHEQGYDVRIEYRFVFFDGEGAPLKLQQNWRSEVMPGSRTQIFLAGTAMDNTARNWRLEIRRAR